jgi:hypothetical protein
VTNGADPRPQHAQPAQTRELVVATLVFAVLTFLMALPFSLSPGRLVLADMPDTHLYIWTLAWDAYAFLHHPLSIFDANIYYPYANTLAYSENLIGSAFFAAPIIWLTGEPVLAMNLAALITCVLCGLGAYLLARRLHLSVGAAFVCGIIFAFAPPRFFRMGQVHMTAVQWIPFSLACLHTYLDSGRRRDLLLAIGFFSLQALASGHGAVYLFLATVALITWRVLLGTPLALRQRLRDVGVGGAYLLAPAVWVMLPYRIAQAEAGLRRGYVSEAMPGKESWLATPAPVDAFVIAQLFAPAAKVADAYLFPGILVLVLAAIALLNRSSWRRLRDSHVVFYLLLGILSTLMFVGRPIEIWRYVYWLPGLNFIRVPSRFIILTMLALSVLAGFGADRLAARLSRTANTIAMVLIAALLLGEYSSYPFVGVPYTLDIPAIDRWLDTQPKPFVVAEVPVPSPGDLGSFERQQTQSMLHATAHWQKTVHGYSGIRRPLHDQLYLDMTTFPNEQCLAALRSVGVTHVVVHTNEFGARWRAVEAQIGRTPSLQLAHVEGDGRVYTLLPK